MERMTHVQLKRFWAPWDPDFSNLRRGFKRVMRGLELEWIRADFAPDFPEIVSDIARVPAVPPAWHQDSHGDFKPRALVIWSNILGTDISIDGEWQVSGRKPDLQERLSTTYLTVPDGSINVIDNVSVYHRGPSQERLALQRSKPFVRAFCRAWLTDECADRILNV
jgi:hypothetical protein